MRTEPDDEQRHHDRTASIMWSRELLKDPHSWCIIDTETTGLNPKHCRVVEITVLDGEGNLLFDSLVNPALAIPQEVSKIHGISDAHVSASPAIFELWPKFKEAVAGRRLIAYNSAYDRAVLHHEASRHELESIGGNWECAMTRYSAFVGAWNPRFGNYRFQKLPSAGHRALVDCQVTLDLVHLMGGTTL